MKDTCKNCGGWKGIHHYQTMQCPVGGHESPVGWKQEYMTSTFEQEDDDQITALTARVAELEAGLEGLKQHANAMLYIFDRALPDQSIGRNACDNLHNAIKAADKLLEAK